MQIKHTIRDSGHNNEVIVWGEGGGWGYVVCVTSCELQKKSSVLFFNFIVRKILAIVSPL